MKLSVVVVNYQVEYFLELCLRSVQKACATISSEIIVVDNNSSDGSVQMLSEKFPEIILIANKDNVGFSTANNQGVARAKGEFVLILNPDTVIAEDTFVQILEYASKQSEFGALGVKLINGIGKFAPESKRGIPTPKVALYKLLGINKRKNTYYANHLSSNDQGEVDVLSGAFMLVKRAVFNEVGGFDEDYFMYGEDIDLSYKILNSGYKNYYFGATEVIHFKGESSSKDVRYLQHFYGAMKIFYLKHLKCNYICDFMMKLGIQMWFLLKCFQVQYYRSSNKSKKTKNVLYIGNDSLRVRSLLPYIDSCEISEIDEEVVQNDIEELWLDANTLSYRQIISLISNSREKQLYFKIRPEKSDYFIGSDSTEGRGELVQLDQSFSQLFLARSFL